MMAFDNRRGIWLAALLLVAAAGGCGPYNRSMPAPADPSKGRAALQTTLETWKSGARPRRCWRVNRQFA